jgi:hypothetical protein
MGYDDYATLRVRIDDGVATVTIDHPPINLFDLALIGDMDRVGRALEEDPEVRVVVVESADPDFFIAHADVQLILDLPPASAPASAPSFFHEMVGPALGSDLSRPVVRLTATPAIAPVGGTVTLTISATDPEGVVATVLKVDGATVPLVGGSATYTSATPGVFTAEAFAYDLTGNEGYATAAFRFRTTGDTTPPTAILTAPADGQEITMPVAVTGTTRDETQLVAYRLEASEAGRNQFFSVGGGTTPVTNGVLGTFDPTLLLNGFYDLRLTAEDASGNTSAATVTVEIDGQAKIGHFSLSFDDLVVPMAGIPITVTRTYDSRNKAAGDFGVGWTLSVKNIEVFET